MGLNKYVAMTLVLFLSGCASLTPSEKGVYEQGYRAGVKEQMASIAAKFQGGQFPYYNWAEPIVQDVKVPAHIERGIFVPEHNELVIIKPGEWMKAPSYPIANQENKAHEESSPSRDVSDITVLPQGSSKSGSAK